MAHAITASTASIVSEAIDLSTAKLADLKAFVKAHGIEVTGNKSHKASFIAAIESARLQMENVTAVILEAEEMVGSKEIAETLEDVAVEHGTTLVEILTSDKAVALYRFTLRAAVFLAVCTVKFIVFGVKEIWAWTTAVNNEFVIVDRVSDKVAKSGAVADAKGLVKLYSPNVNTVILGVVALSNLTSMVSFKTGNSVS